eukprot:1140421-Pelagomonas_calceolata.AAC.8
MNNVARTPVPRGAVTTVVETTKLKRQGISWHTSPPSDKHRPIHMCHLPLAKSGRHGKLCVGALNVSAGKEKGAKDAVDTRTKRAHLKGGHSSGASTEPVEAQGIKLPELRSSSARTQAHTQTCACENVKTKVKGVKRNMAKFINLDRSQPALPPSVPQPCSKATREARS